MQKTCTGCSKNLSIASFSHNKQSKDGYNWSCKQCASIVSHNAYIKNRKQYIQNVQNSYERRKTEQNLKIIAYLNNHPCVDCGEKDILVLHFDHQGGKDFGIGDLVGRVKWETIAKEIIKCDVRCANCHVRRTAKQQNWERYRLLNNHI